jgi:hyperosmotically inducible protein
MRSLILLVIFHIALLAGFLGGCSGTPTETSDVTHPIRKTLDQSGYKNVSVSQNRDKGVVTLTGTVATESDKAQAESLAKSAAAGQVVANHIAVRPPGDESAAKAADNDLDKAIDKNLDTALLRHGLNNGVRYEVSNGVVTLKGSAGTQNRRSEIEHVASGVPNVTQVVNEMEVDEKGVSRNKSANPSERRPKISKSTGKVAFRSEETMNIGKSYPIFVDVSRSLSAAELKADIDRQTAAARPDSERHNVDRGKTTIDTIKITPKMHAHLSANTDEFAISMVTPEEVQVTNDSGVTTWEWMVKPLKSGKDLRLDLSLSLVSDDGSLALDTYHRFINVTVPFPQNVVSPMRDFVKAEWHWLLTAIIVPVAGWIWVKLKKRLAPKST